MDLTDHNDFDSFARQHGWTYDNGWPFKGDRWDSYYAPDEFRNLQLLRSAPNRVVVIAVDRKPQSAVWSGEISSDADFLAMLEALRNRDN